MLKIVVKTGVSGSEVILTGTANGAPVFEKLQPGSNGLLDELAIKKAIERSDSKRVAREQRTE